MRFSIPGALALIVLGCVAPTPARADVCLANHTEAPVRIQVREATVSRNGSLTLTLRTPGPAPARPAWGAGGACPGSQVAFEGHYEGSQAFPNLVLELAPGARLTLSTGCLDRAVVLGQMEMAILSPGPAVKGRKRALRYVCCAPGGGQVEEFLHADPGAPVLMAPGKGSPEYRLVSMGPSCVIL